MFIDEKKLGEAFQDGKQEAFLKTKAPWQLALAQAADVIERLGHTKGQLKDKATGAVCFRGAYGYVNGATSVYSEENMPLMIEAEFAMADYLGLEYNNSSRSNGPVTQSRIVEPDGYSYLSVRPVIVSWNNAPERTPQEVIATMRAVAAL